MSAIWNNLLITPILNLLVFFYQALFGNLILAIVALTLLIRGILFRLTLPSQKASLKQRELMPQLNALKEKHKGDKKKLAEAQAKLLEEHGINPAAGCLPQLMQIVVLIALYQVFMRFLLADSTQLNQINDLLYFPFLKLGAGLRTQYFFWDLTKPDPYFVLPVLAGLLQLVLSLRIKARVKMGEKLAEKTIDKKDDVVYNMQEQMLYLAPIMTILIGTKLPVGLAFYWLVTTAFSLGQQVFLEKLLAKDGRKNHKNHE